MSKETGGPAFPRSMYSHNGPFNSSTYSDGYGMDLRDYFAAKAMQGICARVNWSYKETARVSYEIADAMLEARK
jgi:hypothetical protein